MYTASTNDESPRREATFGLEPLSPIDYAPSVEGSIAMTPLPDSPASSLQGSDKSVEVLHQSQLLKPKDMYQCFAHDGDCGGDGDNVVLGSYDETDIQVAGVRCLFTKAKEYLDPGPLFRAFVRLYAERKLMVFFLMHFMATMIIWCEYNAVQCRRKATHYGWLFILDLTLSLIFLSQSTFSSSSLSSKR